jgi:hypothetical protein
VIKEDLTRGQLSCARGLSDALGVVYQITLDLANPLANPLVS